MTDHAEPKLTTAGRQVHEVFWPPQDQRGGSVCDEPDVLLEVPMLKVDEIDLAVEGLRAHVAVVAELTDLLRLSAGADVDLDRARLTIKGVEAQALLKVRLEEIRAILEDALTAIGENPQTLDVDGAPEDRTLGASGQEPPGSRQEPA